MRRRNIRPNKHAPLYEAKKSPKSSPRGKGDKLTNNQRFLRMRKLRSRTNRLGE